MTANTLQLKENTLFTTGYRGRGKPTLCLTVPAGTTVRYTSQELNDGSKVWTVYYHSTWVYTATRIVPPKNAQLDPLDAVIDTTAEVLVFSPAGKAWGKRGEIEIPNACISESGRLVGSLFLEASQLGFLPGEWPGMFELAVGGRTYQLQNVDETFEGLELKSVIYRGTNDSCLLRIEIAND